jgi:hypothetical protein
MGERVNPAGKNILPSANGAVIAAWKGNLVDLVEAEEANLAMFFADAKNIRVASAQAIGDDDHLSLWEHLVNPAIKQWPDCDGDPELLADFTRETDFRAFSGL